MPFYLDTVGTIAVAAIGGYFPGILAAVVTNAVCSIFNSNAIYYGILNAMTAVVTAWYVKKYSFKHIGKTIAYVLAMAVLSGVIGTYINWYLLEKLDTLIDLYDKKLPKIRDMINAYEELRLTQQSKAGTARINQLKNNFADLFMQVEQTKNETNQVLVEVRQSLYPNVIMDTEEESQKKREEIDETINLIAEAWMEDIPFRKQCHQAEKSICTQAKRGSAGK